MTYVTPRIDAGCGCDDLATTSSLISIDQAIARIDAEAVAVTEVEPCALAQASGRVLASAVLARADQPRFTASAMDGFALDARALTGSGPWHLPVMGRVAAGDAATGALKPMHAVQIFTGAPLPEGADCVVMQEHVQRGGGGGGITLKDRPVSGQNVLWAGEERRQGDVVLRPGARLDPRAIASAAAAGSSDVAVTRPVRVALLVTGAEVTREYGRDLDGGQIWDMNTPMLRSALVRPDAELVMCAPIGDDRKATAKAFLNAFARADLVVSTGGVSVGAEDHLRAAFAQIGGTEHFAGVAIKPGKPVAFGQLGTAHWLGLPGNPHSAFVTWTLFGRHLMERLTGARTGRTGRRSVALSDPIRRKPGRCEVRAARFVGVDGLGREVIDCSSPIQSGQVATLADADGLAFIPGEAEFLPEGALVEFLEFR